MKNIFDIINKIIEPYNQLKVIERNNRIVFYKFLRYEITLFNISEKKLTINSEWKGGLFGKIIFKEDLKNMKRINFDLIEGLRANGISVNEIIKN